MKQKTDHNPPISHTELAASLRAQRFCLAPIQSAEQLFVLKWQVEQG